MAFDLDDASSFPTIPGSKLVDPIVTDFETSFAELVHPIAVPPMVPMLEASCFFLFCFFQAAKEEEEIHSICEASFSTPATVPIVAMHELPSIQRFPPPADVPIMDPTNVANVSNALLEPIFTAVFWQFPPLQDVVVVAPNVVVHPQTQTYDVVASYFPSLQGGVVVAPNVVVEQPEPIFTAYDFPLLQGAMLVAPNVVIHPRTQTYAAASKPRSHLPPRPYVGLRTRVSMPLQTVLVLD
ncbi:hypothetical protein TSUD_381520 [Trifolium subterraneum]|uniref:Uncharacterized protein n=1 Tax=Trifolium subterraneum TaxID=3900 RepID=A0A2Z6M5A1_TRISU|nr:hypothetical protein TSUD_381520 [Trifolium subterraneum]